MPGYFFLTYIHHVREGEERRGGRGEVRKERNKEQGKGMEEKRGEKEGGSEKRTFIIAGIEVKKKE